MPIFIDKARIYWFNLLTLIKGGGILANIAIGGPFVYVHHNHFMWGIMFLVAASFNYFH